MLATTPVQRNVVIRAETGRNATVSSVGLRATQKVQHPVSRQRTLPRVSARRAQVTVYAIAKGSGPMRVIISGAPASGKGTQCETIVEKLGLTHISAGDLLRAEVAAGTEEGKRAKASMEKGELVADEIVTTMVKNRLSQSDAQTKGWLLDGYPRSGSQAASLEKAGIRPELVIILDVPDEVLVERVVGRRMDPETGKIYHLKFNPPPADVVPRLTQRFDDTEEKCRARLDTHKKNEAAVTAAYSSIIVHIDGNRARDAVFADISKALKALR